MRLSLGGLCVGCAAWDFSPRIKAGCPRETQEKPSSRLAVNVAVLSGFSNRHHLGLVRRTKKEAGSAAGYKATAWVQETQSPIPTHLIASSKLRWTPANITQTYFQTRVESLLCQPLC